MRNPSRYFNSSPAVVRTAVLLYIRFPLSLRQIEDLLHERGIDISHETVRFWWNRFGSIFAAELRKLQLRTARPHIQSRWHIDEVFVRVNGERRCLWRAVDHESEVLEVYSHEDAGSQGCAGFPEARIEAVRLTTHHRYRQASFIQCSTTWTSVSPVARTPPDG